MERNTKSEQLTWGRINAALWTIGYSPKVIMNVLMRCRQISGRVIAGSWSITWEQLNLALGAAGFQPKAICRVLVALNA